MTDKKNIELQNIFKGPATPLSRDNRAAWTGVFSPIDKTPVPQAASTANRDAKKALSPSNYSTSTEKSPKVERYMAELLKDIDSMTKEVKQVHNIPGASDSDEARLSVASVVNSSLGILEQDDLKGFEILEDRLSLCESAVMKDLSKRFEKELVHTTSNSNLLSSVQTPRLSASKTPVYKSPDMISRKTNNLQPFDGYDKVSISSEEFMSGDLGAEKILEDERAFTQDNNKNLSLSGIIESDQSISDKLSMSSFLRLGSCPLGSLGENVSQELRPTFGQKISSPEKKNRPFPILPLKDKEKFYELDQVPTKESDWKYDVDDVDLSTVSSVASVSQIAEILRNMDPDVSPHTLIENIISQAKTKKLASILERKKIETSAMNATHFKENFSKLCDSFMTKSFDHKENEENMCPNNQSGKQMQLTQNNVCGLNNATRVIANTSICESENRTSCSSSSNESASDEMWMKMFKKKYDEAKFSRTSNKRVIQCKNLNSSANNTYQESSIIDGNDDSVMYVCVATSVRMDFDVKNTTNNKQNLNIQKCVFVDGVASTNAAIIELDTTNISLEPYTTRTIGVLITPLVAEVVNVELQVRREDSITKEVIMNSVTGKVIGEYPDIKLLSDSIISFDPLHEGCTINQCLTLENVGMSEVPITLAIVENTNKPAVFSFNGKDTIDTVIRPGDVSIHEINCCALPVGCLTEIKGIVEVKLKTFFDFFKLPEILSLPINTTVAPCTLYINQQQLMIEIGESNTGFVQNGSPITMNLSLIPPVGIDVKPVTMNLQPGQKSSFSVLFSSKNLKGDLRKDSGLIIQILPNGKTYELSLITKPKSYVAMDLTPDNTPQVSRAASPQSPGSVGSADGSMQLECTHTSLVWGCQPVHSKNTKSCTLRNRSLHREKLLISIIGSNNCFKLTKDKKKLEDRLQISLHPMESTSLNVVMIPTHAGAFKSSLCITRINNTNEKKALALYGYGGKAKLVPQGVSRDPDQHMWIYLDSNTLSSCFFIKNVGDAPAFVKISQGIEAMGISISPPEALIEPASQVRVEISLTTTPDRLEYLLNQPGDAAVNVTRLIVTLGDESTRHRLNRLYRKLQVSEKSVNFLWKTRLMTLNGLFSDKDMKEVCILRDPISSLETLWHEGIKEWNIGVLAERSLLENMCLDSSIEFVDLDNTILEATVMTPPLLPYIITPPALQFSLKNHKQELMIENMTTKSVPFICQSMSDLQVVPSEGCLSAVSSVKVLVMWIGGKQPPSESTIKVVIAHTEVIEVPISWKL